MISRYDFKRALDRADFRYEELNNGNIMFRERLDEEGIEVALFFDINDTTIQITCVSPTGLGRTDTRAMLETLADLNDRFRFVKFYTDIFLNENLSLYIQYEFPSLAVSDTEHIIKMGASAIALYEKAFPEMQRARYR